MTEGEYTISLQALIEKFGLTPVYLPESPDKILISNTAVIRPGLALAGFFGNFVYILNSNSVFFTVYKHLVTSYPYTAFSVGKSYIICRR